MTFRLGLTGGIGMGKSTAAKMFAEQGIPVWDADETVHRLYARDGAAVASVAAAFPGTEIAGAIDRSRLKAALAGDPTAFARLNAIVHPLVAADRAAFIARNADAPILLFDIPLLYEVGAEQDLDGVAVVSTDETTRRARILARGTMTPEMLNTIISRQMPDAEKRARADWIIPSDTLDTARAAVIGVIADIKARL